jgi:hypothetical protein
MTATRIVESIIRPLDLDEKTRAILRTNIGRVLDEGEWNEQAILLALAPAAQRLSEQQFDSLFVGLKYALMNRRRFH